MNIDYFYPNPESNGYGKNFAFHRFSILNNISFLSLLDVGSGPCFLSEWILQNNFKCEYEAVDIRKESLSLCKCNTYSNIPDKKYDLVCMFGTITYNINGNSGANKKEFEQLLRKCILSSRRYVIFTVINYASIDNSIMDKFVCFTKEEIINILDKFKNIRYCIDETIDANEFMVIVHIL